jgi:sugar/nucleoside kinase (ribokinase family)
MGKVQGIIAGSIGIDCIETPHKTEKDLVGGSACYACLAASHFAKIGMVAVVGEDFPNKYRETFERHGIDLEGLEVEGKTFCWHGRYEGDMAQAITLKSELNAIEKFDPVLPADYRKAKFAFLGNLDPKIQMNIIKQLEKPKFIALDTMNYWIDSQLENVIKVFKKVDLVVLNDAEAKSIIKTNNLISAGKKILELGPKYVIVKKGEHGALLFSKNKHFSAPAYPLELFLDPTGAGDSFGGGLIGYLAEVDSVKEQDIRRGIIYGSVVASFNVEDFSIRKLEKLTRKQIEARYEFFKKISGF